MPITVKIKAKICFLVSFSLNTRADIRAIKDIVPEELTGYTTAAGRLMRAISIKTSDVTFEKPTAAPKNMFLKFSFAPPLFFINMTDAKNAEKKVQKTKKSLRSVVTVF